MTPISNIIRQATKSDTERFNVLSFVTHERAQSNMGGCNANFYLIQSGPPWANLKGNWIESYAPIPKNTIILPAIDNPLSIIPWVDLDLIIAHHKFGQHELANQLSNQLKIPIVQYEHTMPTSENLRKAVPQFKKIQGKINIFISKTSRNQWGFSEQEARVIEHGIDSNFFKSIDRPRKNHILTVGNDMLNRSEILGFDTFQRTVINKKFPFKIIGNTPGLSEAAKNIHELKNEYNNSSIYFNPSRFSPIPMSLLEAMSCGCAILTTDNNLIGDIIEHDINGLKTNDENEMVKYLDRLLDSPEECQRLGVAARRTIINRFNLKRFQKEWDDIFQEVVG